MAHTPGPWGVDSYGAQHSLTEFHIIRGSMPIAKVKKTTMNAEENARLIAAAPKLLEACTVTAKAIDSALSKEGLAMAITQLLPVVRDAIAKAKGE